MSAPRPPAGEPAAGPLADGGQTAPAGQAVLSVRGLTTEVAAGDGWLPVVRGVDLDIWPGRTLGIAGESGSGKTMLALSVLGLLPQPGARISAGSVTLEGTDLVRARPAAKRALLGSRMCAVFQDPLTSLNPLFPVGDQIAEVIRRHSRAGRAAARRKAGELLAAVHIAGAPRRLRSYPHELSGGQRQRVAIAMAIANEPALLVADEPTTALDVTVQAEILELLAELQRRMGMAMIFITHDLEVARDIADQVAVMYAARIVEESPVAQLFADPQHPYTRRLIACAPRLGSARPPEPIPGMPPALDEISAGCPFGPRCDVGTPECRKGEIELRRAGGARVACIRPGARP